MDAKRSAVDVVTDYWTAANARNWDTFGDLLAPDVVYDLPQTRERITGRERYVRFNVEYPGDWRAEPVRIVGDGTAHGATWTSFQVDGTAQTGLCFFDLDEHGLINRITDFWPVPYEPPAGRDHLTERY